MVKRTSKKHAKKLTVAGAHLGLKHAGKRGKKRGGKRRAKRA